MARVGLPKVQLTRRALLAGGAALVAGGVGVAAGVVSCTRGAADVPAEPSAVSDDSAADAGKLGGKLVLYTSCPEDTVNAAVARFSQDAGVTVSVVQGTEREVFDRLAAEAELGEPVADVVWGGDASWYAVAEGGEKPAEVTREVGVFAVASALKTAPAGYADLVGAPFAGRVALCDPAGCEAGWLHLAGMLSSAGGVSAGGELDSDVAWQFVADLVAAGAVVCDSETDALQMVLDGDADVALVSEQCARQQARRTGELDVVWPEEGMASVAACVGVVSGCRNEAQATAFVDFLVGHDGQQVLADALARPAAEDVSVAVGDGVPSSDDLDTDGVAAPTLPEEREALLATWASVQAGEWAPAGDEGTEEGVVTKV